MKILRIFAKRVWGLQQIDLKLDGRSLKITGGNRRGKSSVLKAIQSGIYGPVDGTIHEDATEGEILIEMDEVTIHRIIDEDSKTRSLTVRSHGEKVRPPQKFLDRLARALLFNPVQFYLEKPRAQRDMLLNAIQMEIEELDVLQLASELTGGKLRQVTIEQVLDAKQPAWDRHPLVLAQELYATFYDERRILGQRIDSKQEVVAGLSAIELDPYEQAAHEDVQARLEKMDHTGVALREAEAAYTWTSNRLALAESKVYTTDAEIARLEQQLAERRRQRATEEEERAQAATVKGKLETQREEAAAGYNETEHLSLRAQEAAMASAKAQRDMLRQMEANVAVAREEIVELEEERAQLDIACSFFKDSLPAHLTSTAKLPVEGLTVDDNGILVHGRPLSTLSEAEKMTVAIRIAEAQATDEEGIQFILLDGIERLDAEQIDLLEERAKAGDVQFIMTQVTSGDRREEFL